MSGSNRLIHLGRVTHSRYANGAFVKLAWMVGNAPTLYSFGDYCIACLPHPYRKLVVQ